MLLAAVSDEGDVDLVAGAALAELAEEVLDGVQGLVVELGEDVAGLDAGGGGGAAVDHLQDQDAGGLVEAELGGHVAGHLDWLDAEEGVGGAAGAEEVGDHVDGGGGGDGEPDGDRALRGWDVGVADADDLAAAVDQRAAGVARGDRGVGLDEVDQRADALLSRAGDPTVEAGDDAGGDGVSKPKGLPIAIASSPTCGSARWKVAGLRSLRSTWTTARSVLGSVALTVPGTRRPSKKATSTRSTTWSSTRTTWLLVTTTPSLDQTTPLPVPWSWATVTTDGSTLRTTWGMSPVAACALGAITGAGAERACGSRPSVQPPRAAASTATSASEPRASSARRCRGGRVASRLGSHAAGILGSLSDAYGAMVVG
jgi:hypothetical protein